MAVKEWTEVLNDPLIGPYSGHLVDLTQDSDVRLPPYDTRVSVGRLGRGVTSKGWRRVRFLRWTGSSVRPITF